MKFESITPLSFRLIDEGSGDTSEYRFREKFSLWQLKQMGKLYDELTSTCTHMGAMVITTVLTGIQATTGDAVAAILDGLSRLTENSVGDGALIGSGEIVRFLVQNNNIERIAAILFLKPSEKKLDDETFDERVKMFEDSIEPELIVKAAQCFFEKKLAYFGITLSHLRTFVKKRIELATLTSADSTTTLGSMTDISTPLPRDIQSESLTS